MRPFLALALPFLALDLTGHVIWKQNKYMADSQWTCHINKGKPVLIHWDTGVGFSTALYSQSCSVIHPAFPTPKQCVCVSVSSSLSPSHPLPLSPLIYTLVAVVACALSPVSSFAKPGRWATDLVSSCFIQRLQPSLSEGLKYNIHSRSELPHYLFSSKLSLLWFMFHPNLGKQSLPRKRPAIVNIMRMVCVTLM